MSKPSDENWEKSQKLTAINFKGTIVPGSGSGDQKLDIRAGDLLIENKWTGKESLTLKKSWLKKARSQAINMGCAEHIILIDFEDSPLPLRYVLVPEYLWFEKTEKRI